MALKSFAAGKIVQVSVLSVLIVGACAIRLVFADWINVRGESRSCSLCWGNWGVCAAVDL